MDKADAFWQFGYEHSRSATVDRVRRNNCIRWQYRIIQNLCIVVYLNPMSYDATLANLDAVSNFEGTYDTIPVNVYIVANGHLCVP